MRVRIEGVEHARDRALVNGLVDLDRVGEVLLHHAIEVAERFQALADGFGLGRWRTYREGAKGYNQNK